jgi:hypothetical protein
MFAAVHESPHVARLGRLYRLTAGPLIGVKQKRQGKRLKRAVDRALCGFSRQVWSRGLNRTLQNV